MDPSQSGKLEPHSPPRRLGLIIGGVAMIVNSFLQLEWILFLTIAALVLIPIGYSFLLFKKGI